jgi:hypothetical protein
MDLTTPNTTTVRMNLLVIYSDAMEECERFYTALGMRFTPEHHGKGPRHYAAVLADGTVFEIYPAAPGRITGTIRLGLTIEGAASRPVLEPGRHVLRDPDGRAVDVEAL